MAKYLIPKVHTLASALERARKYCAYQERSQQEVRDKLYTLGLHRTEVEQSISILIEEGFLSEQRFAVAFAGGKFRISKWGKIKIRLALSAKKVTDYCIREALNQIPQRDYEQMLNKVIELRKKRIAQRDPEKQKYLLAQYAISRGYEPELVWEALKMKE